MRTRKRNAQARITLPTPEQIRARREAENDARLRREADGRDAAKRPENWGLNGDGGLYDYRRHVGTQTARDGAGRARTVWRDNPFTRLVTRGVISADEGNAGMDLLRIYASARGLDGPPDPERGGGGGESAWNRDDRRMHYGRLYAAILAGLSRRSRALAEAFTLAWVEGDRPPDWRDIVADVLDVADPARQTVRFQVLCEELVDVIPAVKRAGAVNRGHREKDGV